MHYSNVLYEGGRVHYSNVLYEGGRVHYFASNASVKPY